MTPWFERSRLLAELAVNKLENCPAGYFQKAEECVKEKVMRQRALSGGHGGGGHHGGGHHGGGGGFRRGGGGWYGGGGPWYGWDYPSELVVDNYTGCQPGVPVDRYGQCMNQTNGVGLIEPGTNATAWTYAMAAASLAGAISGAYHGYKRNNGSVGWAFGWSVFGGLLPFFSIPLSLAEGFGKPEKK